MRDRERARAFLKVANEATEGPWRWEDGEYLNLGRIAGEYTICQFGGGKHWDEWKGVEPEPEDREFIAASRTEAPYFAQRLLDALDVIRAYESECLCRLNGAGRCDRCVNARQFLEGSESHG